jgi:hypothetical protein
MATLAHKRDAEAVIDRLDQFYAQRPQDRICARFDIPSRVLPAYLAEHPVGFCGYPDPAERAAFWDAMLAERAGLEDDAIPCAYLSELDQGLYGGLVGGQVEFLQGDNGWVSSMTRPILADWSGLDALALRLDDDNPWLRRYLRQLDAFAEAGRGKFGLSHFILIDGLNFAFELAGATQTYLALSERPEWVRRAVDFAFDLNAAVQDVFFARAPSARGGTCSNMAQWMPGRVVSESVDPFHMTSVGTFERWGRANVERMFARYDGGVLHLHGNGRHLLEAVSTLRGLKLIWLGDDRGFAPAFEALPDLKRRVPGVLMAVSVDYGRFTEALQRRQLPGGVFYHVSGAPDEAAANRCMERVRAYRC